MDFDPHVPESVRAAANHRSDPTDTCQILLIVNIDSWTNIYSVCSGTGKSDEKVDLTRENKLAQFNNWFTWCHNCRHGGHAGHMLSWFRCDSHACGRG